MALIRRNRFSGSKHGPSCRLQFLAPCELEHKCKKKKKKDKSVSGQWDVQQTSHGCTSSSSELSLTLRSSLMDDILTKHFPHCHDLKRRAQLTGGLTIKMLGQGNCRRLEFQRGYLKEQKQKQTQNPPPFITAISRRLPDISICVEGENSELVYRQENPCPYRSPSVGLPHTPHVLLTNVFWDGTICHS